MFLPLGDDVEKRTLPVAGTIIVGLNLLVFAYELRLYMDGPAHDRSGLLQNFIEDFGLVPVNFRRGDYLGIFTYMFLHGGFSHLIGNMICLWAFVQTLEHAMGAVIFISFYVFWGLVGGYTHVIAESHSDIPMIGASGAVAGMIGAYFVKFGAKTNIKTLVFFYGVWRVNIPAAGFVGIWVLFQVMGTVLSDNIGEGGIAYWAHIGGFAAGVFTMKIAGKTDKDLIRDRHGGLEVKFRGGPEKSPEDADSDVVPQLIVETTICPHCGTEFTDDSRIAPSLYKCVNPECERLTYTT